MLLAEIGGDVVEIGHGLDVEPDVGNGHHHVGMAEAEPRHDLGAAFPVRQRLAHQVLAGDAEVHRAGADLARDLRGGQEDDLDVAPSVDPRMILARIFRQADRQAGLGQNLQRLILEAAFRGQGEGDGHGRVPPVATGMPHLLRLEYPHP